MKKVISIIILNLIIYSSFAQDQVINGNLHVSFDDNGSLRLGRIGNGGNLYVPKLAETNRYNIDFTGYRDIQYNQVGARISAIRFNNYEPNAAYIQNTALAFYTNPLGLNSGTTDLVERMRISPQGNIGIGTANPQEKLQIGDFPNCLDYKLSIPGCYNFEQLKMGQYGNGSPGLEFINHGNSTNSYGIRLLSNIDLGQAGLHIQTADFANSYSDLTYNTKLFLMLNGNLGIGTQNPRAKLDVSDASENSLKTVLARLEEGNNEGEGTYLGVKSYHTQFVQGENSYNNVKSFSIEHKFYGQLNNAINFYRGGGVQGGSVGISVNQGNEVAKFHNVGLDLNGTIRAREVKIEATGWADHVFDKDYSLPSLQDVKSHIEEHRHLPGIPSEKEVLEEGINIAEMQVKLLQKIEELTLYMIDLKKENEDLKTRLEKVENH